MSDPRVQFCVHLMYMLPMQVGFGEPPGPVLNQKGNLRILLQVTVKPFCVVKSPNSIYGSGVSLPHYITIIFEKS